MIDSPSFMLAAIDGQLLRSLLPWLIALVVLVLVGGVLMYAARRLVDSQSSSSSGQAFTLHDLRQLHAAGDLSDEEFERAKAAMIGRLKQEVQAEPESEEDADSEAPDADNEEEKHS